MAVIKSGASTDQLTVDPSSKAARTTLYTSTGNEIDATIAGDGEYHLNVGVIQDVFTSVLNTDLAASIGASSFWEGAAETTLGVAGIQVNTFLTQAHTVTVFQSMDDSNFDISDSWDVPANYGSSRTTQATASSFKVRVTNKSAGSTATGRIQSDLCPVVEALPRGLTSGGNLKVSVGAEWQSQVRTTGIYSVTTPRTIGAAAGTQNLFVLQNPSSLYWVAVRSLTISSDSTAVLTSVAPLVKVCRATSISGGTSWTANIAKYHSVDATPNATALVATTADDAALTAITATPGAVIRAQSLDRMHTLVGLVTHNTYNLLPELGTDLRHVILAPGENLLVYLNPTAAAATTTMIINCVFIEMLAL